jgi:tRNA(Ile)-lysidine synthase TilS/MesJ
MIRPLIFTNEKDITPYARELPVVKSCCPANKTTKRERIKEIISLIGKDIPEIREMVFTALVHPERYNLFDKFEKQTDEF